MAKNGWYYAILRDSKTKQDREYYVLYKNGVIFLKRLVNSTHKLPYKSAEETKEHMLLIDAEAKENRKAFREQALSAIREEQSKEQSKPSGPLGFSEKEYESLQRSMS